MNTTNTGLTNLDGQAWALVLQEINALHNNKYLATQDLFLHSYCKQLMNIVPVKPSLQASISSPDAHAPA